jgi:hypothetical protein
MMLRDMSSGDLEELLIGVACQPRPALAVSDSSRLFGDDRHLASNSDNRFLWKGKLWLGHGRRLRHFSHFAAD